MAQVWIRIFRWQAPIKNLISARNRLQTIRPELYLNQMENREKATDAKIYENAMIYGNVKVYGNVLSERENRFMVGYEDGLRDKREKAGRALGDQDADYGAGYVSAKYNQLLG